MRQEVSCSRHDRLIHNICDAVSKQPRMHAGKQPHAFASNGSKTLKTTELTNII